MKANGMLDGAESTVGWVFEVRVEGFPRTANSIPNEIYGGHLEQWAVLAPDIGRATEIVSSRVYSECAVVRRLARSEADCLKARNVFLAYIGGS